MQPYPKGITKNYFEFEKDKEKHKKKKKDRKNKLNER